MGQLDPGELAATTAAMTTAGWSSARELHTDPPPAPRMCTHCVRRSGVARGTVLNSIVCTPCWAELTDDTTPQSTAESNVEASRGLPRTARDWDEAIHASTWYQRLRRDVRRRLEPLLDELARRADWTDHLTWPTWARLQQASGWSRSSVASWLAKLKEHGWLTLVEPGSTPQYRGPLQSMIHGRHGNRAAVYQLHLPDHAITDTNTAETRDDRRPLTEIGDTPSESRSGSPFETPSGSLRTESWTPTGFTLTQGKSSVHTRAKTIIHSQRRTGTRPGRPEPPRQGRRWGDWFDDRVPTSPGEMLGAARQLRDDPLLARLSPRAIRARVKPFWRAGWTNNDLRHALDHQPSIDGPARRVERCPARQVRWPSAWLRHRLTPWTGHSGPLRAPHADSQARAAVAARHGRAAAQRLSYGHTTLPAAALRAADQQRAEARLILAGNQARDRHALLTGLVPAPDIDRNTSSTREAARAHITALLQARLSRRLVPAGASC
ncbi:hypothetical protein [Pseudonocardia sp. ICBG1293]|uniref:hypothetical protein n=1 Tax=Pseudonocardia sp. ICBG1293 TaxID=2844382 RepID=UPI001CCACFF9|nr:hypothetical protein [Pseudonocardia sp. ICBG1293]